MTPPHVSSGSDDRHDRSERELVELVREFANHPPPPPTEATWQRVRDRIAARLTPATPPPVRRTKWVAAVAALAACVLIGLTVWSLTPRPEPPIPEVAFDPLAEYDVLPIATANDVMVSIVRGDGIDFASIDHPIPPVMPLATTGDLTVETAHFGRAVAPDAPWVVAEPWTSDPERE
jgi:hypothetical protein